MIFAPKFTCLNEEFLHKRLEERREQNAFRRLRLPDGKTDFCSNDYLGIATDGLIERYMASHPIPLSAPTIPVLYPSEKDPDLHTPTRHGSAGSRLLAGNYPLIEETEKTLASFHQAETGLIFNSGYDANLGLLSSVPQRGDTVLYDYLSHASIRDGMRLSFARSFSFGHNDTNDLEKKLETAKAAGGNIFVVTESVFSMDGDEAPLAEISSLCRRYEAHLLVDEAHATGVIGEKGEGLVQSLGLQDSCLARIHTFGKALGCHGAIVLGSAWLRDWLINFSRPFIYTTALPPSSIAAIRASYELFPQMHAERKSSDNSLTGFSRQTCSMNGCPAGLPYRSS